MASAVRGPGPNDPVGLAIDAATKPLHVEIERLQAEAEALRTAFGKAKAEELRLTALINTPRTDDFFEAVRIEAAHQIERWGVEHDAGKRPEDWIALVVYLLGKATKAHYESDRDKLLHHVITLAAVALNWHRNATGVSTAMRPGEPHAR